MAYFVYIIGSSKPRKRTYVGWTKDISKRISKHNSSKGAKFTRGSNWILLYQEELNSKTDAMKRENELKKEEFNSILRNFTSPVQKWTGLFIFI